MQLLIEKGANPNIKDSFEGSALHKSIYEGQVDIVKFLLENGALTEIKDSLGLTPLQEAAITNHTDIAKLLVHQGANVDLKVTDLLSYKNKNIIELVPEENIELREFLESKLLHSNHKYSSILQLKTLFSSLQNIEENNEDCRVIISMLEEIKKLNADIELVGVSEDNGN